MRPEIAIKTALGAGRGRLIRETVSLSLALVLVGEAAGLSGAIALGTFAPELLYGVSPRDPTILGAVLAFLFLISLISAFCPAWIAAGSDPRDSLRAS